MQGRDRDDWNVPPPSTQTGRALPTHSGASRPAANPAKTANVEGPIIPGTFVTQRFERNDEGGMFERKIDADLILLLDAVVESKGYTAKIRVDVFDSIWSRYDGRDYGSGQAGRGVYDDVDTLPTVWVVDNDLGENPERRPAATRGPQQIQPATTR